MKSFNTKLLDLYFRAEFKEFPDIGLPDRLFDGIPFKELPVVAIKVTKNNTILTLNRASGPLAINSGGREGFKNCRKGTNVAAQAAATGLCKVISTIKLF